MIRMVFPLLLALALCLHVPTLAVEGEVVEPTPEPITVETEADDKTIVVNVTLPAAASPVPVETPEEVPVETAPTFTPYSVAALDEAPIPELNQAPTLADTVTAIFGPYTPRTQTITDYLTDGSSVTSQQVIPGLAGLDWPWLAGVGIFTIFLYGLLRLIGGLMKL